MVDWELGLLLHYELGGVSCLNQGLIWRERYLFLELLVEVLWLIVPLSVVLQALPEVGRLELHND